MRSPAHRQALSIALPYSRRVNRRVLCALVALAPARGFADGLSVSGGSPRAIGRAGAATVGDDGGGALLINPAAMARRDALRAQLGLAIVDDQIDWRTDAQDAFTSKGQAGSSLAPIGAVIGGAGDWIIGAGAMTSGVTERRLAPPNIVIGDLKHDFDYRYAGISGAYRRDTITLGAARRLTDTLALGLSIAASQVRMREDRRIWAGFNGLQPLGSPNSDIDVGVHAIDRFVPSAVAGLLYAPEGTPIELGASVAWSADVRLSGDVTTEDVTQGPQVEATGTPSAAMTLPQPVAIRAGGRYVGDRIVGELDGDVWIAPARAASRAWTLAGLTVQDPTLTLSADLPRLPSRIALQSHVALRTAVDVELVPGFLWATAGYAYAGRGTPAARTSPTFADLGGHTLGLGLEATSGRMTVTLGWSRTWALAIHPPVALRLDNPFNAGDGPVPAGTYDGSLDQVGVLLEASFAGEP